jgi:type 1 glutamine amidotransferase
VGSRNTGRGARFAAGLGLLALALAGSAAEATAAAKMKVLVVTGGHAYDTAAFNAMWDGFPDVAWTRRDLQYGHEVFADTGVFPYDILVFYNHQNPGDRLTQKHKDRFQAMLDKGVGIFVFHHAIASYPFWPEFEAVAGVKYRSADFYKDSLSTYQHDQTIPCSTLAAHPYSAGLPKTFTVTDEMYFKMAFAKDNRLLLTTSYAGAEGPMAWTRVRGHSRIFTTLLGHGPGIFSQPAFRQMLINALNDIRPCASGDAREACKSTAVIGGPGLPSRPEPSIRLIRNGPRILRSRGPEIWEARSVAGRLVPL